MSDKEKMTDDLVLKLLKMTFSEFDKCLEFVNVMKNKTVYSIAKSDWESAHFYLCCLMGLKEYSNSEQSEKDTYSLMEENTLAYHAKNYPDYK